MEPPASNSVEPTGVAAPVPLLEYVPADLRRTEARAARKAIVIAVALLTASVTVGAALNAADDAAHRVRRHAAYAVFVLGAAAAIALLSIGAAALARARAVTAVLSVILVLLAVVGSQLLFNVSPLRHSIGWIRGDETVAEQATDRFAMRLYLCWTPTVIVGGASLLLWRSRRGYIGFAAAMAAGLGSAVLWGAQPYAGYHRWLIPLKWPKLLSTGLLLLVLLLLCQLLAGAIESFRHRHAHRALAGGSRMQEKGSLLGHS
jgi:uncharacterized membrane protein